MTWIVATSLDPENGVYQGLVAACGTPNSKGRSLFANCSVYWSLIRLGELHGSNALKLSTVCKSAMSTLSAGFDGSFEDG
jgi:hypothetical protein